MTVSAKNIRAFSVSCLLASGVLTSALSHADDTEIFFGGPTVEDGILPNVLFILDNSGSMNWRLDSNSTASKGQVSRLDVLKDSFEDIMRNTTGINAGVMVLNSRTEYGNSNLMFPVTNISSSVSTDTNLIAPKPSIQISADDATQSTTLGSMPVIDAPALAMGATSGLGSGDLKSISVQVATSGAFFIEYDSNKEYACRFSPPSGKRNKCDNKTLTEYNLEEDDEEGQVLFNFTGLNIPANAEIIDASLYMRPTKDDGSKNREFNVKVEKSKTPNALNDDSLVGSRTYETSRVTTTGGWKDDRDISVDLTSSLKVLTKVAPANDPVNGVLVRIKSYSDSKKQKICTAGSCMPRLVVNYKEANGKADNRIGALRFQDVGIPQGAKVTDARISFVPAASSDLPVTFSVRADKSLDPAPFSTTQNFSTRINTANTVNWSPGAWVQGATPEPVEGPNVTSLVQGLVSNSDWCGNNAMAFYITHTGGLGSRTAYSIDGGGGLQPVLSVSYTGGDAGCINPIIEMRVTAEKNDGREDKDGYVALGTTGLAYSRNHLAARYEGVPLKQGAQIINAKVLVTPSNTKSGSQTSTVTFEDVDNSGEFTTNRYGISVRKDTANPAACGFGTSDGGWVSGQPVTCDADNLRIGLQSIVSRSGWKPGNALSMFVNQSGDSDLTIASYESNPSTSMRLRLKIKSGGVDATSGNNVKNHLISLVNNMSASSGTPVVPVMLDAAKYIRGTYPGRPTPITSSCQATHIVLLTDGQANNNTSGTQSAIGSLVGKDCTGDATDSGEKCGRSLSKFMFEQDQSSLPDISNVTTHTVGFALDASGSSSAGIKSFLSDIASNGGGTYNTAESSSELAKAFKSIIQKVLSTDASFVSASAPVNSFNRQDNKDEVYFSVFKPSQSDSWAGNLKRYRLDAETAQILDVDGVDAVDKDSGFFKSRSRSWWTTAADGNNSLAGGAANQLPAPNSRKLFTYIGDKPSSSTSLNAGQFLVHSDNTLITESILGVSTDEDRAAALSFIRGFDANGFPRKTMGDPLHSSPRLATYACNTWDSTKEVCTSEDQSAVVGTNEGFVHVINTSNGVEQLAFMPQELLPNIEALRQNAASSSLKPRKYGMDNTVSLWVNDANNNGVIYGGFDPKTKASISGLNSGEHVYAYATMGRGGRNIYALDITDRSAPKALWEIKGGSTAGFERLGQTWSVPARTKIKIGSKVTDVLIFGGGYDATQDDAAIRKVDSVGNAVYIVNAKTGALIWSASPDGGGTGAHATLSQMKYSIPSSVRVIDLQVDAGGSLVLDNEQIADQFFVGDMGGQVWRFHINNGSTGSSLISPAGSGGNGLFATVTDDSGSEAERKKKARRFYNEPDVALINLKGVLSLAVSIGSGYRGHPLDAVIEDRFYSFRTSVVTKGDPESTRTESSLYNATANLITSGTTSEKAAAKSAFDDPNGGWMLKLKSGGEKVLSRSLTLNGSLYFNTYEPTAVAGSCGATAGKNRAYSVSLYDASPSGKKLVNGEVQKATERYEDIKTTGLLSDPTVSSVGKHTVLLRFPSVEKIDGSFLGRTYWMDQENLE